MAKQQRRQYLLVSMMRFMALAVLNCLEGKAAHARNLLARWQAFDFRHYLTVEPVQRRNPAKRLASHEGAATHCLIAKNILERFRPNCFVTFLQYANAQAARGILLQYILAPF